MANYQQPNPYNNLQYWYKMQQQQQGQLNQQQQLEQLEQLGYIKKQGCNCSGNKKKNQ
ncbi:cytochrome C oxidase subunit III [Bacillus sp. 3103sda1]|uniref:cytochrome C oxidase subunit III n=1 Tax=Bacillus sp. 3103sda1 TaxID=2953808 RepID=UPI0035C8E05C